MTSLILSTMVILTTNGNVNPLTSDDINYVPVSVLDVERMEQREKLMREGGRNNNLEDSKKLNKSEEFKFVDTSLIVSV